MSDDPLAQFRKTPLAPSAPPKAKDPNEYIAFSGKDKALYLEIRRANDPAHSPRYQFLMNVFFDDLAGTNFVLIYGFMVVKVWGKNLKEVVFAIQNNMAVFIQEYDSDRWPKPMNDKAPFIERIQVFVHGSSAEPGNEKPTTH